MNRVWKKWKQVVKTEIVQKIRNIIRRIICLFSGTRSFRSINACGGGLELFAESCDGDGEFLAVFCNGASCDDVSSLFHDVTQLLVGVWSRLIFLANYSFEDGEYFA